MTLRRSRAAVWIVAATVLLGVNQGLTWSMTQTSKLDLTTAEQRGLTIDLTIGSSWPPGSTTVTPGDSLHTLLMGTAVVRGPRQVDMPVPPLQVPPLYKYKVLRNMG